MNDILSIIGLGVGIVGVIVTVTIFIIQFYQNNRERKIQELLRLQDELAKCGCWCKELGYYNWYSNMKFSETEKELEHAILVLEEKIRFFKSNKFIYLERYDKEIIEVILNYITSLEIEIRILHEHSKFQNAFIEHYFKMGNPHDENGWEQYEHYCDVIKNTLGAFRYFEQKLQQDNLKIHRKLKSMKYRTNVIEIKFDVLSEEALAKEIKESKKKGS